MPLARTTFLFLLAALALVASGALASAAGGGGDDPPEQAPPPPVISGTAKMNCERIVAAGYSPHDYVRIFGAWWYWPGYDGPEGARMSSIWGRTPECRAEAAGSGGGERTLARIGGAPEPGGEITRAPGGNTSGGSRATQNPDQPRLQEPEPEQVIQRDPNQDSAASTRQPEVPKGPFGDEGRPATITEPRDDDPEHTLKAWRTRNASYGDYTVNGSKDTCKSRTGGDNGPHVICWHSPRTQRQYHALSAECMVYYAQTNSIPRRCVQDANERLADGDKY